MTTKAVRRGVVSFFLVYLLAVTWPLATLFGSAEPMILGLPFSMAWVTAWILMGFVALLILDHFECREEDRDQKQRGVEYRDPQVRTRDVSR
ncbi:MAG: hypothetical protein JJU27_04950 [Gammaproteobacteria bacterium]|nr:hypothetical protein [Gammaproteobacteria bacterium]